MTYEIHDNCCSVLQYTQVNYQTEESAFVKCSQIPYAILYKIEGSIWFLITPQVLKRVLTENHRQALGIEFRGQFNCQTRLKQQVPTAKWFTKLNSTQADLNTSLFLRSAQGPTRPSFLRAIKNPKAEPMSITRPSPTQEERAKHSGEPYLSSHASKFFQLLSDNQSLIKDCSLPIPH